ncbi:MAG: MmgE/PrpD family protein, partial [Deltaproteobacteria bacterium]|nr:MmgE/PrpD family protein [Deltaproteobacteria bacterium]
MPLLLEEFVLNRRGDDFPPQLIGLAKKCLLDMIGNIIAGGRTEAGQAARSFAAQFSGVQEATIIGSAGTAQPILAAFANAVAGSALDADDGHRGALGHPGAVVVPAALAAAEVTGASGGELLEAIIVGYEVAIRAGLILNAAGEEVDYGSGAWGSFGAAAAGARLDRVSPQELLNAL